MMPKRPPIATPTLIAITLGSLCVALLAVWLVVLRPASDEANDKNVDIATFLDGDDSPAKIGEPAPNAPIPGLNRPDIILAEMRGRIVVLNFWASTCAPCVREMPLIEEVSEEYGDEVAFLGVSVSEEMKAANDMLDKTGVTYEQGRDPDGSLIRLFGGIQLPHTVVIDRDGVVTALANRVIKDKADLVELIDSAA